MKDPVSEYRHLNRCLKDQLKRLEKCNIDNSKVKKYFKLQLKECKERYHGKIDSATEKIIYRMALYHAHTPMTLMTPKLFNDIYCYCDNNSRIYMTKEIKTGKHAKVIEGRFNDKPVIIKWYESSKRDTYFELSIYKNLKKLGCKLPWFTGDYSFWGKKVLILEKLSQLSQYDDEYKLGIEIIQQLKLLHKFGVHCDIKPQNIMRRVDKNKNAIDYLLIDFGGVATDKMSHGYHRWLWSPKWTSQKAHQQGQLTTPINDFLELGFTMRAMQNWRDNHHKSDGNIKEGYSGRLAKYMERIKEINPKNVSAKDYDDLIKILSNKRSQ